MKDSKENREEISNRMHKENGIKKEKESKESKKKMGERGKK